MTHDDLARDLQSLREMAREASNAFEDVAAQEQLHRKLTQNLDTIIAALEALRSFSGDGGGSGVVEVDGVRYGPRMVRHMREQIESLSALKTAPDGWRSIDTAPKDGTPVILAVAGNEFYPRSGWWDADFERWVVRVSMDGESATGLGISPTHWMPLPASPIPGEE